MLKDFASPFDINIDPVSYTHLVDSPSLLEQLKNVLSLMRGVKIVSDSPVSRLSLIHILPKKRLASETLSLSQSMLFDFFKPNALR